MNPAYFLFLIMMIKMFQTVHYSMNATCLRRNPIYSVYYIMVSGHQAGSFKILIDFFKFGNFIIMSLIPVILLTVLNYLIFRGIRK